MSRQRILVTAGPAREPIDAVRWITNLSTGNLGKRISEALADAGFEVVCLWGEGATAPPPKVPVLRFGTNASLIRLLQEEARTPPVVVLHAAALCDYLPAEGVPKGKVRGGRTEWVLRLVPAPRAISLLRGLFPQARIVAWKYEVEGDQASVIRQGHEQLATNQTDACVLNGPAWGGGFGFIETHSPQPISLLDPDALCGHLIAWIRARSE